MKVNQEMAQLQLDTSLLVVMGSHHGILYKIEGDELTQVDELRVDAPIYSDNEGMFQGGKSVNPSYGSVYGSVLEPQKKEAQEDFSKEFSRKVQDVCTSQSVKAVYLFAPLESKPRRLCYPRSLHRGISQAAPGCCAGKERPTGRTYRPAYRLLRCRIGAPFIPASCAEILAATSKSLMDSHWSADVKELISERFDGNYTQKKPAELMDMVYKKIAPQEITEPTGEAKKILENTERT